MDWTKDYATQLQTGEEELPTEEEIQESIEKAEQEGDELHDLNNGN